MSLPQLVVFSIKDPDQEVRYLSFTGPHRQLRFGIEEGVYTDTVPFTVEQAGSGLVHIRSCFENKYWVRVSRSEPWLVASSLEKVDDISKDECTLFRPQFSAGNVFVSFVHVQSGFNVVMRPPADAHAYNLCAEQGAPSDFSFIRYSQLRSAKLPKHVMFVGDNNLYLTARSDQLQTVLHFETQSPTDQSVGFEIMHTKNGDVQVKSMRFGGLWGARQISNQWQTVVYPNYDPNDPNTLFEATRSIPAAVAYEGVSLRNYGVNLVCFCLPHNRVFGLANVRPNDHVACLRPRPAVQQGTRRVNIEEYRHAWVSRLDNFLKSTTLTNSTNVEKEHLFIEPNIAMHSRTTFRNSVSHYPGPSAIFNGLIPFVDPSGELQYPDRATTIDSNWGHTKLDSVNKTHEEKLVLPPKTRVSATVYKKLVIYDIPFSYQQTDTLLFGGNVTQHLHEGTCRVQVDYDTELRIRHTPIPSAEDISQFGVELVPGSGIFESKGSDEQDEESDEQDGVEADETDKEVDAFVSINTNASEEVIQKV